MKTMRANVFRGVNEFGIEEVPRPTAGPGEAVIRITLTTICGTDLHIVRGEYPVKPGMVIGHEPVGVIEELGPANCRGGGVDGGSDAARVARASATGWWTSCTRRSHPRTCASPVAIVTT
jgi:D-arabinose 1-dehydrogenase-like Zn-dependent alcohol dehydrogenase